MTAFPKQAKMFLYSVFNCKTAHINFMSDIKIKKCVSSHFPTKKVNKVAHRWRCHHDLT